MTKTQKSTSVADIILSKRLVVRKPTNPGKPGEVVWVDPNTLHIDHNSYQRDTNEKHALKIGAEYKYDRAKVISGYRCSTSKLIYVTDGQHSSIGAAIAGIPVVPVYVFDLPPGATIEDVIKLQSAQFVAINKSAKKIQKFDEFRNDLIQEAPYALGVQALCAKYGVTLIATNKSKGVRTLSHIQSIVNSYTQIGSKAVDLALAFITKFWPTDHIEGPVLMALARFLKRFEEAKASGIKGSDYDDYTLYQAITLGGLKMQKEIESFLTETATEARISTYGEASTWRAKAMARSYNDWVDQRGLGVDKQINTKVLV